MSQAAPHATVGPDAGVPDAAVELAEVIDDHGLGSLSDYAASYVRDRQLPTLDLPGFGEAYDECGDPIPHFCEDCGSVQPVGRTCKRSECPRCAPAWALDRAPGLVGRLDATARMMSSARDEAVYKHHVVFSPPPGWATESDDPLDETFHTIRDLLELMDAEGVVAYHPWAGDQDGTDDMGAWKDRLFSGRDWEDVQSELQPRGHFHAVVASPFIAGGRITAAVNEMTDWVIHRVEKRDGSGRSLSDLNDVARAVTYTLSHTGIDTRGDGHNQAAYRTYGATWHDADVLDDSERLADAAVREVAPRLLGLPTNEVSCGSDVREARAGASTIDHRRTFASMSTSSSGEAPEPDGDPSSMPDQPTDATVGGDADRERCSGRLRHIDEADGYLDDDDWRERAPFASELRQTLAEWELDEWAPPD